MIFYILVLISVFFVYLPWIALTKTLSSGDWPYLFLENIQAFKIPTEPPFLWLEPYYQLTAKLGVQVFSLSWETTEKIFWFLPFLAISLVSSYLFLRYIATHLELEKKSLIFIALGSLIFTTNTYVLMLTGGGQMGVAMAYSLVPLTILVLFKIIQNSSNRQAQDRIQNLFLAGLVLGVQLMFDPRIFLLSMLIAFIYTLFNLKQVNIRIVKKLIIVLVFAVSINLFWILPNFGYFNTEYKVAVDAANADYLSFATFSNSISLLHPNWPENIFGKIGFMKSEFIILPILAYMSLFFLTIKQFNNKTIIFFAFLGLFGAFFAKGTNPPFGELYGWLSNFPGFSIFRDPTKFYVLVIVSYMVLIPFSLYKLTEKVSSIKYYVLSIAFLAFWLALIHPVLSGQLSGTFKPHDVPKEYIDLKNFLYAQSEPTKTLWVPSVERFGFNSRSSPAISAMEIFGVSSVSGTLDKFGNPEVKKQLIDEEVKYIIIPYDYLQEIFLTDRKYDDKIYIETVSKLKNINWLSELSKDDFGKIKVFLPI